ncbi:UNVERIFIED_CONTAM: Receptor-like protein kinase ANXUR1 [Sesamum radiatum]|uniref:Receptor-like protein kinase ANXUR1 n=1 Tax=Sesamum radiatum TaxID=300843 RepID=A0AAW2W3M9_SESRA
MNAKNHILFLSLLGLSLFLNGIHGTGHHGPGHGHHRLKALILSCGSSASEKDADERTWEPDEKYILSPDKGVMTKSDTQDPSLPSTVPYMTARIFKSETAYLLPLQNSTSRTLLRLHFYPSSYPNFNISNSYFSVTAGGVTLLSNFSSYLAAQALSQAYFIKEYYLAAGKDPTLTLTFKPSDKYADSFAFVNGIEVISAPAVFDADPVLAGSAAGSINDDHQALTVPIEASSMETMFRLNVGGQYIGPANDSDGLMRSWYDDTVYLYGGWYGVATRANITVDYKGLPSYMAPLDVYRTYRRMGPEATVNLASNLTWIFQVDPSFMYLLRLHWCDSDMTRTNQRVFDVFVNNKTAASEIDVFALTGSLAAPTKRDYVVHVNNNTDQLWLALHPHKASKPEFADALLNGLEIFKLSDNAKSISRDLTPSCQI